VRVADFDFPIGIGLFDGNQGHGNLGGSNPVTSAATCRFCLL
jgi:hypothetical protein